MQNQANANYFRRSIENRSNSNQNLPDTFLRLKDEIVENDYCDFFVQTVNRFPQKVPK